MKTKTTTILLLLLLALPLQAQLVFDQNPQIIRTGLAGLSSSDTWIVTAETSELACRAWKNVPIHCQLAVVARTDSNAVVLIYADIEPWANRVSLRDSTPTLPGGLPWTTGPISFSGTWKYAHAFATCPPSGYHPCCKIPGIIINVDDPYSGSFDFDLDGEGNPINVSVSFTLSEQ